eukprot:TRINITY_DN18534_c0_g1_i1.p1 TRINITY_DN18534_c0_g1~~TRINITY_DN18534_c0_g1_i1.p1  ORF type:complete len:378 (-),score=57.89 TRINITY_DN18534_c0_g1_i1:32-1165(-)
MKGRVLGFIVLLLFQCDAFKCPSYECQEDEFPQGICMLKLFNDNQIKVMLKECPKAEICKLSGASEGEGYCVSEITEAYLYPGEHCTSNHHCFSKICEVDIKQCRGVYLDGKCKADIDCNPGLFCRSQKCVEVVPVGGECNPTAKCGATTACHEGKCTKLASLPINEKASLAIVCASFYIFDQKCAEGPKLKKQETRSSYNCSLDEPCNYTVAGKEFTEKCLCGMSNGENGFCVPGTGDNDLSDFSYYVAHETDFHCHIEKGPLCIYEELKKMNPAFYKAYISYMNMVQGIIYIKNPPCVVNIYNKLYWDIKDLRDQESEADKIGLFIFLGIAIGIILLIGILLIIIYIRRDSQMKIDDALATTQNQSGFHYTFFHS